jgi:hypothetical protein
MPCHPDDHVPERGVCKFCGQPMSYEPDDCDESVIYQILRN